MKNLIEAFLKWKLFLVLFAITILVGCSEDDDGPSNTTPSLTGNSETFTLFSRSNPGISGTAEFAERDDGVTVITIQLSGTSTGGDHPAHIHANTAAEGGPIVLDFTNIDGSTGTSVTEVSQLNDGTPVSYGELIDFDGYLNVHLSAGDLATLVAQGDIGQNELNGNSVGYTLSSVSDPNIFGTATLEERINGEALLSVQLEGTTAGGDHPAHIHENDAATGGGIVLSLNNVDGATGVSLTNVTMLDDGTAITYSELTNFNGYINVHLSEADLATLVAQGDIGTNAN